MKTFSMEKEIERKSNQPNNFASIENNRRKMITRLGTISLPTCRIDFYYLLIVLCTRFRPFRYKTIHSIDNRSVGMACERTIWDRPTTDGFRKNEHRTQWGRELENKKINNCHHNVNIPFPVAFNISNEQWTWISSIIQRRIEQQNGKVAKDQKVTKRSSQSQIVVLLNRFCSRVPKYPKCLNVGS